MSAPKKEGLKPLKDRTIKDLAGDAAKRGMRLQIGTEPLAATTAQLLGQECCYCPLSVGAHWHALQATAREQLAPPLIGRSQLSGDPAAKHDDYTDSIAFALYARPSHSVESISATIASLSVLAETLPDITQMADGAPFTTGTLKDAVKMLSAFRGHVSRERAKDDSRRKEAQHHGLMAQIEQARAEGIEEGMRRATTVANQKEIKADAKEARKGRRGAKKS